MDYIAARRNMVESQIRPNRVSDERVVAAMSDLPREIFVPKPVMGLSYIDEAIAIGEGRYLMEPMVTARLLQAATIGSDDVVLDVGCGTGYVSALLAGLASTVVGLECDPALAEAARENMSQQEFNTVTIVEGPLEAGHADMAPYDVIFVNGAVPHDPETLTGQLADGGRLVVVLTPEGSPMGKGILFTMVDGVLSRRDVFDAGTPSLPGFSRAPEFVF